MTSRLIKIFGKKPDWSVKVSEYSQRLAETERRLNALKAERLEHVLPATEGDNTARGELDRIDAEISAVERQQVNLLGALEQARGCLAQQQEHDAAEAERKRQEEYQRRVDELIRVDEQADSLISQLRSVLDAREVKLQELKPFAGVDVIRHITNRSHVERVLKYALYPYVDVQTPVRSKGTLAELDGRMLGRRGEVPTTLAEAI